MEVGSGSPTVAESPRRALRVLLLEDNPDDEVLVRRALERSDLDFEMERVETREAFEREVAEEPDVILADHMLPDFDATGAVAVVREAGMDIPVIVVSGTVGEETAVKMMKAGADDYLLKDRLGRLGPAIRAQLERRRLRDETTAIERRGEDQLRRSMAILRATDQHRRQLLRSLSRAQEEERRRIAEGIHDDTVQIMAGAAMRLSSLRRLLGDRPEGETVGQIEDSIQRAIRRLRHLVFELRPTALDRGLAAALQDYVASGAGEAEGLRYRIDDELEEEPPPDVRGPVYRIIVEALRNVHSHARARLVEIALRNEEDGVRATVGDDGVGFDVEEAARTPGHVGLTTMRERAETLGGRLDVESQPGRGTTVTIWVPAGGEDES